METWSNEFVKGWMIGLGLDSYLYIFQDEDFDGKKLVSLTETELVECHKVEKKIARRIILKRNEIMKLQANEKRNSEKQGTLRPRRMSILKRASLSLSMRNLHEHSLKEPKLSHNASTKADVTMEKGDNIKSLFHNKSKADILKEESKLLQSKLLQSKSTRLETKSEGHTSRLSHNQSTRIDNNRLSNADIRVSSLPKAGEAEHNNNKDQALSLEQLTRISIRNALHHNPVARDVCMMLEKLDFVEDWDPQDVLIWLDFVGFPNYKPNFKAANISGKHLLALTNRDLSKYLKIYDEKDARTLANHIRLLNVY